ncbi:hypothetical protein [Pseudoalteromonas denitrificans]|uniref:Uncharacterized protein n=1 Tax=Pseudoalteromonas denitrificans DSM 6059 TaxID=1123010 RepID=A0A1I1GKB7_9GAMM|nr:hypothetical protein [Pseudoalteromonas denitrificans]SFC11886.1 hypothetical protein SAMN02745724_00927 [Pseudoalteromonas denitrificans DSM 6059]
MNLNIKHEQKQACAVDNKVIVHIGCIVALYFFMNFVVLDLAIIEQRSIGFYLFFSLSLIYLGASKAPAYSFMSKQTDYEPVFLFNGFALSLWFAITDLILPTGSISKFSGVVLIFGIFGAFGFLIDIGYYIRDKKGELDIPRNYLIATRYFLLFMVIFAGYFFIEGNWEWPLVDIIVIVSKYVNGY